MEQELKRFVVWTYYLKDAYGAEPGWIVSGSFDNWEEAVDAWMSSRGKEGAGQSHIMEVCKLRIERVPVEEVAFDVVFGKINQPF